jgi:hypothetical protein
MQAWPTTRVLVTACVQHHTGLLFGSPGGMGILGIGAAAGSARRGFGICVRQGRLRWPIARYARDGSLGPITMNTAKEIAAYAGLALLAVCVLSAGIVAASITGGVLGIAVGAVAAAGTFQALRRVTGRMIAAAVDSL